MYRPAVRSAGVLACGVTAAVLLAGCAGADDGTRSEADAAAAVQNYADQMASMINGFISEASTTSIPCGGAGSFRVRGSYVVPLTAALHPGSRARHREVFTANGLRITTDHTSDGYSGEIAGVTTDRYSIDIASMAPPTGLTMRIDSPCFAAPPGQAKVG
jgi:hypothetical protein